MHVVVVSPVMSGSAREVLGDVLVLVVSCSNLTFHRRDDFAHAVVLLAPRRL